jgi:diguanylate cyclase (GGDEF)-like protein
MSTNGNRTATRTPASLARENARLLRKVAELERLAAESRERAYHDTVTGLPNRALLLERLNQALLLGMRKNMAVGVLMVDLDGFKGVNDRFGHRMGDLLLKQVATRIQGCIRASDTACRYGGDEFVIMVPQARGVEETHAVKRKLAVQLSRPYELGEHLVMVGASIGTAVFNGQETSCDALIHAADMAMYAAKVGGVCASWRRSQLGASRGVREAKDGADRART